MSLELLSWREPLWLLLALQPVVLLAVVLLIRRWRHDSYAEAALLPWARAPRDRLLRSSLWRAMLLALAWLAFAIALAGPRVPDRIVATDTQHAAEVMLVIDLSRSMSAGDVSPSRMERAKLKLTQLVQYSQNVRFGIVVFAARAHLLCPPTHDKQVLHAYLTSLRTRLLPTEGSNVAEAIHLAARQMRADSSRPGVILLSSDGETVEQPDYAQLQNIRLHVFGFGTRSGAALLDPQQGWLTHEGQPVISRLNSTQLELLAARGHGTYTHASDSDTDWQEIYRSAIAPQAGVTRETVNSPLIIWSELYHGFIIAAVLLLLLAHWQPSQSFWSRARALLPAFALFLIAGMLSLPQSGHTAEVTYRQAYAASQQLDFAKAQKLFANIPGHAARMGEGHALYQLGNYPGAAAQFVQAVLSADNDAQRANALFNLGNAHYKLAAYARAAEAYADALRYQPGLHQAAINLEFARALEKQTRPTGADNTTAQRSGRGPRMATAPENMTITQGRVALDDTPQAFTLPPAATADTSPPPANSLDKAKPAASALEIRDDTGWTYDSNQINASMLQSLPYRHDASGLWKRLFEWEENFPAPVTTPHDVPGVMPW